MTVKGFDISRNEKEVDYAGAKAAGMEFGYVCTWAGGFQDLRGEEHRLGIQKAGMLAGPYYVWNKGNATASGEPERMMKLAEGFELIPSLDFEKYVGEADLPPREFCINWLGNFTTGLNRIYKDKKLFYTNLDGINHLKPIPDWLVDNWLLYLSLPGSTWTPERIAPWKIVTVHQYQIDTSTSWGKGVDLDGCNVPLDEIKRKSYTPPPPPEEEEFTQIVADLSKRLAALEGWQGQAIISLTAICKRQDNAENKLAAIETWARNIGLK